jgi:hypothetical protein
LSEGIIWIRQGYNPAHIEFYDETKNEILGEWHLFSDNTMVILTNTKYFYTNDLTKLAFINQGNTGVQPDKIYLSIYNNLDKTLETIGLEEKKVSILKLLENLNTPNQTSVKQLPTAF